MPFCGLWVYGKERSYDNIFPPLRDLHVKTQKKEKMVIVINTWYYQENDTCFAWCLWLVDGIDQVQIKGNQHNQKCLRCVCLVY